jgi:MFS family permease
MARHETHRHCSRLFRDGETLDESSRARGALARFFGANVLFAAGLFAHAFLYNFYLESVGAGEGMMGGAAASMTAGGIAALLPAGRLVDRRGPGTTYGLAVLVATIGLVWSAWVTAPAAIYATGFLAGAGTSAWRVAMGPAIMRLTTERMRSRAFSWNVALLVASGSLWTALAGASPAWFEARGLDVTDALRAALIAGAVLTLLGAVLLPRRPIAAVPVPTEATTVTGAQSRLPPGFAVVIAVVALWMCAGGLVIPFFNVFFQRVHDMNIGRIGAIFGAAQLATAAALAISAEVAARAGPRRVLSAWTVLFTPALLALAWAGSPGLAVALYLVAGFVPPATNPLIDQILLEDVPVRRHGIVSTWRNAATEVSGLVGASLGGILLQATSFVVLLSVAGGVAAVGAVALHVVLRRFDAVGSVFGPPDIAATAE